MNAWSSAISCAVLVIFCIVLMVKLAPRVISEKTSLLLVGYDVSGRSVLTATAGKLLEGKNEIGMPCSGNTKKLINTSMSSMCDGHWPAKTLSSAVFSYEFEPNTSELKQDSSPGFRLIDCAGDLWRELAQEIGGEDKNRDKYRLLLPWLERAYAVIVVFSFYDFNGDDAPNRTEGERVAGLKAIQTTSAMAKSIVQRITSKLGRAIPVCCIVDQYDVVKELSKKYGLQPDLETFEHMLQDVVDRGSDSINELNNNNSRFAAPMAEFNSLLTGIKKITSDVKVFMVSSLGALNDAKVLTDQQAIALDFRFYKNQNSDQENSDQGSTVKVRPDKGFVAEFLEPFQWCLERSAKSAKSKSVRARREDQPAPSDLETGVTSPATLPAESGESQPEQSDSETND